jgi:(1->4)-alpha-D-glucan 1-alpha-D-glucosylmutase
MVHKIPDSTYRIQFHREFTFYDAMEILPYLKRLGTSHLYASPYLQAVKGSTHGYDVVDPSSVNVELGGEEGHGKFCSELEKHELGQVLDIVPNHMAISLPENIWWRDVLENGPSSRYASYFDVDWEGDQTAPANRVLLPVLEDHYGKVLDSGLILLEYKNNRFIFTYRDHIFPGAPRSLAGIIRRTGGEGGSPELLFLADALDTLPLPSTTDRKESFQRHRNREVIFERFSNLWNSEPGIRNSLKEVLDEVNSDPQALDELLERQNYRLAFWRKSREDMAYRRFFDINSLVGLCVEDKHVFRDSHSRILEWAREGILDGLRVDHPDGLKDPAGYFQRLRENCPDCWIVAEKILHPGEQVRQDWPIEGTTGYDFMNIVNQITVNPASREKLTDLYQELTERKESYEEVLLEKKGLVMDELFASDMNRLVSMLSEICSLDRHFRDYTRQELADSLRYLAICLDVYRTYISPDHDQPSEIDCETVKNAIEKAYEIHPDLDRDLLDFIGNIFFMKIKGEKERNFIYRFQQLTGPVMAKGAEDTAFYCYNRLIGLNEVGGDPGTFGISTDELHRFMSDLSTLCPSTMISLNTHDTKRSSDVRCRLAAISEYPDEWSSAVRKWMGMAKKYRTEDMPEANTEYFLFQTLVGAWPIERERLISYLEKAARENKEFTSWLNPDEKYEKALFDFADKVLSDETICRDIEDFVKLTGPEAWHKSLAQTLLLMTAPGVPDIYQGTELWNLSLVDPDNRRPVDYKKREKLLDEAEKASWEKALEEIEPGFTRLWMINRCLSFRKDHRDIFNTPSNYGPLNTREPASSGLAAFTRGEDLAVIIPWIHGKVDLDQDETEVCLPSGKWRDLFTGDITEGGWQKTKDLVKKFPLSLLYRDDR